MAPPPGRKRTRVVYVIFVLAIVILFLTYTREANTRVTLSSAPGGKEMSRLVRQVTHSIRSTFGDDDDDSGGGGGGGGEGEADLVSATPAADPSFAEEPASSVEDGDSPQTSSSSSSPSPSSSSSETEAVEPEPEQADERSAQPESTDAAETDDADPAPSADESPSFPTTMSTSSFSAVEPPPPPEPESVKPLFPMRCGKRLALKPHVKIPRADTLVCDKRAGHADAPLFSVVAAVDVAAVPSAHWPSIVQLMRDSMGTPETKEDERTPPEIVLAIYGVLNPEEHDAGMKEVKEALSGENDFLLILPAGGGDDVGRDTAIARALRVSRATLTLIAGRDRGDFRGEGGWGSDRGREVLHGVGKKTSISLRSFFLDSSFSLLPLNRVTAVG